MNNKHRDKIILEDKMNKDIIELFGTAWNKIVNNYEKYPLKMIYRHRNTIELPGYKKLINEWFSLIPEAYRMPFSATVLFVIFFIIIRIQMGNQVSNAKPMIIAGISISRATIHTLVFMIFMIISGLLSLHYYQNSKI